MKKILLLTTLLTGCAVYPHSYYSGSYYTPRPIVYESPVYVTPYHYHHHHRHW
jgi:hypothetical protein